MGFDRPQGSYDPRGYVDANPATYPPVIGGGPYRPGMWWAATAATGITPPAGMPIVHLGDRIYATGPAGYLAESWPAATVDWLVWHADVTVNRRYPNPYPYSGCLICPDRPEHDGGWSLIVDAFYNPNATRLMGDGTFGSDVFGGPPATVAGWWPIADVTAVNVALGDTVGASSVPVARMIVDVNDPGGDVFDFASPHVWHLPFAGSLIRVGVFDPAQTFWPLATGYIDRIEDRHDTPHRAVTVEAFGLDTDLSVTLATFQGPTEPAYDRVRRLLLATPQTAVWDGWLKNVGASLGSVAADAGPRVGINIRAEIDRVADSIGWTFDVDRYGFLRFRNWPPAGTGSWLYVSDCPDQLDSTWRLSTAIRYVADRSQVLNVAELTDETSPAVKVGTATDTASVNRWGRHDHNYGFPKTGLCFYDTATADALASRAVSRFANVITHVEGIYADTLSDPGWFGALAALELGTPVRVYRLWIDPMFLDGVVIGVAHRITRNRWEAELTTSTVTPTL